MSQGEPSQGVISPEGGRPQPSESQEEKAPELGQIGNLQKDSEVNSRKLDSLRSRTTSGRGITTVEDVQSVNDKTDRLRISEGRRGRGILREDWCPVSPVVPVRGWCRGVPVPRMPNMTSNMNRYV